MNLKSMQQIPMRCIAVCTKCRCKRLFQLAGGPDDGTYRCSQCQEFIDDDDLEIYCAMCGKDHEPNGRSGTPMENIYADCSKCGIRTKHEHIGGGMEAVVCSVCMQILDGRKPLFRNPQPPEHPDSPQLVGYRDDPRNAVVKDLMDRVVRLTELNGQLVAQLEKGPVPVVAPQRWWFSKKDTFVLIGLVVTIVGMCILGHILDWKYE